MAWPLTAGYRRGMERHRRYLLIITASLISCGMSLSQGEYATALWAFNAASLAWIASAKR